MPTWHRHSIAFLADGSLSYVDPGGADDFTMMVVAGRIAEHLTFSLVEMVKGQRVGVGLETLSGREIFLVPRRLGDTHLADLADERNSLVCRQSERAVGFGEGEI